VSCRKLIVERLLLQYSVQYVGVKTVLKLFLLSRDIVCKGTPTRQALRNQGILILVEMHEALFEIILLATGAFSASPRAAWDLDFSQKPRNAFVDIFIFDFVMARCTSKNIR